MNWEKQYDSWKLATPPDVCETTCLWCGGKGEVDCVWCGGAGVFSNGEICYECVKGKLVCDVCGGSGVVEI